MAAPWEILTTPALLAEVRAWALTTIPPYPATAAELRAAADLLAPVVPVGWTVAALPDGLRIVYATCTCFFLSLADHDADARVYGIAMLSGDDQVFLDWFPPGFIIGKDNPKLSWPVEILLVDGRNADAP